jgi:hypothetical protein
MRWVTLGLFADSLAVVIAGCDCAKNANMPSSAIALMSSNRQEAR